MISQFLVYIQGCLSFLFFYPYLSSGLTLFGKEEIEQQEEKKYILYLLSHFYPHICLNFAPFHCYIYLRNGVLVLLVLSLHSHYL